MNQSELVDKVAQKTTLTQAAATEAVKAVVQAMLESLVAGEQVQISGLGTFNVAVRPARDGRNPQTGRVLKFQPARQCGFTQARLSKMPSTHREALAIRSLRDQRDPRCPSKQYPLDRARRHRAQYNS